MCQRDLSGDDLVIVGYVGGRVLAAVLKFDSQPQPELLEVHVASPPIDADPLPDPRPEASAGGPIGLGRDGDEIALDATRGVLDLLVDERELARRAEEQQRMRPDPARGYEALYVDHGLQADQGCDLDFLVDPATRAQ
jgi:hypothetical protein